MQKLILDQISHIDNASLSHSDLDLLKNKRNKQLLFFIIPYLVLIGIGIYLWSFGPESLNTGRSEYQQMNFDEEDTKRFWAVAPYVFGFFLLMATIYFTRIFFQEIFPLIKDLKNATKSLIYYTPDKNPMPVFNKYYLSMPFYKKRQIQVSREDFETIRDNDEICVEAGPSSLIILRLQNKNKEIKFY